MDILTFFYFISAILGGITIGLFISLKIVKKVLKDNNLKIK
jgi:uncharacterized protein YneF (UPF0154 family)